MDSIKYYDKNAKGFFDGSINVDMSSIYNHFLSALPEDAKKILDAGCGSGRDAKFFVDKGFDVTAFDASSELVKLANEVLGQEVLNMSFDEVNFENEFDGIWCCASLLHVEPAKQEDVLQRLANALKDSGVIYVSYKYGESEGLRNGRYFCDMTERKLHSYLEKANLKYLESWITSDLRPGRESEKWLNAILGKK